MSTTRSRSKRKPQRKHEVRADLANFELAKARSSLNLQIYAKGEKIGEIKVGRGSLFWFGRGKQKFKRVDWTRFADMMNELAYGHRV